MKTKSFRFEVEVPARSDQRIKKRRSDVGKILVGVADVLHLDSLATFIWGTFPPDEGCKCHFLRTFGKTGALPDSLRKHGIDSRESPSSVEVNVSSLAETQYVVRLDESELIVFFKTTNVRIDSSLGLEEPYIEMLQNLNKVIFFAPSHLSIEIFFATASADDLILRSLNFWKHLSIPTMDRPQA